MQDLDDSRIYLSHKRAIIYVGTDLLSLLPDVGAQPAALRWEDKVLACNHAAQSFGILDNLPFKEAVQLCPGLIILGTEHIKPLAEIVNQVNKLLRKYSCSLERVNLDECYLDVSSNSVLTNIRHNANSAVSDADCPCGCHELLVAARLLADQLQLTLSQDLRVRSRTGVSYCKLYSRLAAVRSCDNTRLLVPQEVRDLLLDQDVVNVFPGKLGATLQSRGIHTIADIRKLSLDDLQREVGLDEAITAVNAACGIDLSPVITCDLWRLFCVEYEIREKFCVLLLKLFALVEEDGRTPVALKVSVRKSVRKTCSKEAKTVPISSGVPACSPPPFDVMKKLLNIVMACFRRLVDMTRPFQLSLLGLAFVRFQEFSPRFAHSSVRSVASCLLRKRELSVEVPFAVTFEGDGTSTCDSPAKCDQPDCFDVEEQPHSEKKAKLDIFIKSKMIHDDSMDVCSPSKLKVEDLTLSEEEAGSRSLWQC